MGYRRVMGYGSEFPANQLSGPKILWDFREYGLSGIWVKREVTVLMYHRCPWAPAWSAAESAILARRETLLAGLPSSVTQLG